MFNYQRTMAFVFIILLSLAIEPASIVADEDLFPIEKLTSPVLIIIGNSSGSGFLMRSVKTDTFYLITAKHVLFNDKGELLNKKMRLIMQSIEKKTKLISSEPFYQDFNLEKLASLKMIKYTDNRDFVIVPIFKIDIDKDYTYMYGFDNISTPCSFDNFYDMLRNNNNDRFFPVTQSFPAGGYRPFNNVKILRRVVIGGYPTSLTAFEKNQEQAIDPYFPLFKSGIVAGKNNKKSLLIIDSAVYPGNSGEPVWMIEETDSGVTKNLLIGLVTSFIRFNDYLTSSTYNQVMSINTSNSGYSVVEPMDAILHNLSSIDTQMLNSSSNGPK